MEPMPTHKKRKRKRYGYFMERMLYDSDLLDDLHPFMDGRLIHGQQVMVTFRQRFLQP